MGDSVTSNSGCIEKDRVTRHWVFKDAAIIVGLAAVYFVVGKLGLMAAFVHASATPVWPPTGISLAALLLLGYRVWPGVLLGAFLVNITTQGAVAASIGIAVGNTAEAVLGAYLINRFADGCGVFDRPQNVFKFAGLAALLSTMVSATVGVSSLALGGLASWNEYSAIWLTWWLGDATGAIIIAPLVILWSLNLRFDWDFKRVCEAGTLLLSVVLVGLVAFGGLFPGESKDYPLAFLCIPPLVWAGFRFGQREAATASFLLSASAIWGTLEGYGPFVRASHNESLLLLHAFMGVVAVTALGLAAVVSERRRFEMELKYLVDHDPLTKLMTRRRFELELDRQLARARRYGTQGALLYIDLDDFKSVNDTLGHQAGDLLLTRFSRRLKSRLRDSDLVARLGGDEFVVLLPHTNQTQAQALASDLLNVIAHRPVLAGAHPVTITASIGIALFSEHPITAEQLLARADFAMYRAKTAGCNRCWLYKADRRRQREVQKPVAG